MDKMNETVLKIDNVSKKYGQQNVLEHLSLEIQKGDIYGLIGRNGAGKTTLMKIITSLSKETSGKISLFGTTKNDDKGYRRALSRSASIIETPVAFEKLTAFQNLDYYSRLRGITNPKAIQEALEFVELTDTGKKKYKHFSLGMKQKLGLALAMLGNPDFIILDEPINGLDPVAIVEFRLLLNRINQEYNTTIMISSHILSELYQVVNRFGVIHKGRLVKELTKSDFDEICKEGLLLTVDDTTKASILLEENISCKFKVISSHDIRIYDYSGETSDVHLLMARNNIKVNAIQNVGNDLEHYFLQLIEESK